jgi:hypothetical protein
MHQQYEDAVVNQRTNCTDTGKLDEPGKQYIQLLTMPNAGALHDSHSALKGALVNSSGPFIKFMLELEP